MNGDRPSGAPGPAVSSTPSPAQASQSGNSEQSAAADYRALADQADAEAVEAEFLAAAARARARAIRLRRQAAAAVTAAPTVASTAGEPDLVESDLVEPIAAEPIEIEPITAEPIADQPDGAGGGPPSDLAERSGGADPVSEADKAGATNSVGGDATDGAGETDAPDETDVAEAADAPDETDAAEAADALDPTDAPSGRRTGSMAWTATTVLAALVTIAALAGTGWMIVEHRKAAREREQIAEFTAAARQGAVTMTSLNFNDAPAGVRRILDNSTGSFKDDFSKMADDFVKVVEQSKVVAQGSVQSAALDRNTLTKDSAVVLVASTSEVTNAAGAKQEPRTYRLMITVARDGGRIKIAKVEFVP